MLGPPPISNDTCSWVVSALLFPHIIIITIDESTGVGAVASYSSQTSLPRMMRKTRELRRAPAVSSYGLQTTPMR